MSDSSDQMIILERNNKEIDPLLEYIRKCKVEWAKEIAMSCLSLYERRILNEADSNYINADTFNEELLNLTGTGILSMTRDNLSEEDFITKKSLFAAIEPIRHYAVDQNAP